MVTLSRLRLGRQIYCRSGRPEWLVSATKLILQAPVQLLDDGAFLEALLFFGEFVGGVWRFYVGAGRV